MHRDGVPLYIDRAICDGGADVLRSPHGLAGHPVFGAMLVSPARREWLDVVRSVVPTPGGANEMVSATLLAASELLCCRYMGSSATGARRTFAAIWAALRPALLGRAASPPRIWST
jgi:urease accessory protein